MDARFIYLFQYVLKNNVVLNKQQFILLSKRFGDFLNSLDSQNTYFLKGSGTYGLLTNIEELRNLLHLVQQKAE